MAYLFQVTSVDKYKKTVITTFPTKELAAKYAASVRGKVKRVSNKPKINVSVTSCVAASLNMQKEAERQFNKAVIARSQSKDISQMFEGYMARREARKIEAEKIKEEKVKSEQNEMELDMALSMLKVMQEEATV